MAQDKSRQDTTNPNEDQQEADCGKSVRKHRFNGAFLLFMTYH